MKLLKRSLAVLSISVLASGALAKASSPLAPAEIRSRLEVLSDVYTLDASGKKLLSGPDSEGKSWIVSENGKMMNNWGYESNGNKVYLHHIWSVLDDGTINVSIEEFKNGGEKLTGSIEKKEFILENFEPILWKPRQKNPDNIVIRLIPRLKEKTTSVTVEGIPLSGTNVTITDNAGYLWADGMGFSAKFAGFKTHRGVLVMSFSPFKAGKEIGEAEGNKITLRADKNLKLKIVSETDFLPKGVTAKIYGFIDTTQKSKRANSVHGWDSNSEERILKGFRN